MMPKIALWAQPVVNDASFKKLLNKIVQQGRQFLQSFGKSKPLQKEKDALWYTEAQLQQSFPQLNFCSSFGRSLPNFRSTRSVTWFSKLLPRNANSTLAGIATKYVSSQSGRLSLYAFVGVGFATKVGLVGVDNGPDIICKQIHDMFSPDCAEKSVYRQKHDEDNCRQSVNLNDLDIGGMIAKGSNAAVYEAKLKTDNSVDEIEIERCTGLNIIEDIMSNDTSEESEDSDSCASDFVVLSESSSDDDTSSLSTDSSDSQFAKESEEFADYKLALKMVFNLHAESNATQIIQSLGNEALPAQNMATSDGEAIWEQGNHVKKKRLPPHPNIVEMYEAFVDDTVALADALSEYPAMLPVRLNPSGYGRNKTFYTIMKRYDCTLREYLQSHLLDVSTATSVLCQLLEAVHHLTQHGIAHRDIKTDNVLVDIMPDDDCPRLVLSDFGCASADAINGLLIPYNTSNLDKGGNPALMAPEIARAHPGPASWLDYRKADIWALGTLVYEIFGLQNPFYSRKGDKGLDSRFYTEDELPGLPETVPENIRKVTRLMLQKDPSKRPSAETLLNMLNVTLWAPWEWFMQPQLPPDADIIGWLLVLSAQVSCQRSMLKAQSIGQRSIPKAVQTTQWPVELVLKQQFLARLTYQEIKRALRLLVA